MSLQAYPLAWAQDEALRAAAGRWQRRGLLTAAQQAAIVAAHPADFYRPVLWLRVGLFIATWLGGFSATGALAVATGFEGNVAVYCLVAMAGALFGLEQLIKKSRHYYSGVDNALLYGALCAWGLAVSSLIEQLAPFRHPSAWLLGEPLLWFLLLVPAVAALVRYADPVVAVVAFSAALLLLANVLLQVRFGRLLLPFGVMSAAAGLHGWLRRLPARADYFYYRRCIQVLRVLALATFYLAGDYLVVREGNAKLAGSFGPSAQIPLAPVFYVCTASIPLAYFYLGLRRHDRLLLTLGLLAVAGSMFTLRFYHAIMPPEVAATVGGLVMMILALGALRYLRTPRHGLTAAADDEQRPRFNLESLVTAQTARVPAAPGAAGFEFGGGHSGGGGAEGRF